MKRVKLGYKLRKAFRGSSKGLTLIEVLVALALFSIIAITFAGSLGTASRAAFTADIRSNAESLARTEMEYVKSQGYDAAPWGCVVTSSGSEPSSGNCSWCNAAHKLSPEYAGYVADVEAQAFNSTDNGIQKISVTVSHEGKEVINLEGYKVFR